LLPEARPSFGTSTWILVFFLMQDRVTPKEKKAIDGISLQFSPISRIDAVFEEDIKLIVDF